MRERHLVSVVIPTFDRAVLVPQAIDSALAQESERTAVEVLIIDDASTDDTTLVLARYGTRIRVLRSLENRGQAHARNIGLRAASGGFLKFLDSDDWLEPHALDEETAVAASADADIVVAGFRCAVRDGGRVDVVSEYAAPTFGNIVDDVLAGKAVPTGAALYRRSAIRNLEWDERLRKLDDWDFFVRAALDVARIARRDAPSYCWRVHRNQLTARATMLENAIEHHLILDKIHTLLCDRDQLTTRRRLRLAQYYYKELRVLCLNDRVRFTEALQKIEALDDTFRPRDEERQRWMRHLCGVIGVRRALLLHSWAKTYAMRSGIF